MFHSFKPQKKTSNVQQQQQQQQQNKKPKQPLEQPERSGVEAKFSSFFFANSRPTSSPPLPLHLLPRRYANDMQIVCIAMVTFLIRFEVKERKTHKLRRVICNAVSCCRLFFLCSFFLLPFFLLLSSFFFRFDPSCPWPLLSSALQGVEGLPAACLWPGKSLPHFIPFVFIACSYPFLVRLLPSRNSVKKNQ